MKYCTFNYIDGISLSDENVDLCSHQGDCTEDVQRVMELPEVKSELDKIDKSQLVKELSEYGAWSDEELENHQANLERILWIAAGNIADGEYYDDEEE